MHSAPTEIHLSFFLTCSNLIKMSQKYNTRSKSDTPITKILSWQLYKADRKATISDYILELLSSCESGMTCREMHNHSGIWVQSLTNPLKTLVDRGKLDIIGIKRSNVTKRLVQVYGMANLNQLDE